MIVYTSMSGNTKYFADMVKEELEKEGIRVDSYRLELGNTPTDRNFIEKYDAVIFGTYTWGKGELPIRHKDYAYEIHFKPKNSFVFGTGDTQFGEENFCKAAEKLAKYYNSPLPAGKVEQVPTDSQEPIALEWIESLKTELKKIEKRKENETN